jgi:hypothetical protein
MGRGHAIAGRITITMTAAMLLLLRALAVQAADGQTDAGTGTSQCQEDAAAGAPPTYTQRFDPRDGENGASAFARARERAMRFCAQKACTRAGRSETRKASVYGLGSVVRGRLIVGFNCLPPSAAPDRAPGPVRYPLDQPSDIDEAAAKAREHCAAARAKAELVDLLPQDNKLVAVFECGS